MNTTNYKQYDTRWAKLPYRYNPDNIGNNGCGEVSVCNGIIEMVSQMNQTPATMVDYCRQFACSDGTYHSGIPKMLEHYGCTEVMEHPNFASLWRELEKGNRIAVYLMDSTPAGSKGVHWTSGGHFVASVAYKCENGQHWVYMKDSNSISELRNGWITYEGNIRGACPKVWSGKLNGSPAPTPPTPTPTPTGKIAVDGVGGYETVKRLQEFLGLSDPDGLVGRQRKSMISKYVPSLTAVSYSSSGYSNTVMALQKWLGLSDPDGLWGKNTSAGLQRRLRDYGYFDNPQESIDGIFGAKSMRALQTALNNDFKDKTKPTPPTPPTPTPTTYTNVIDVSYVQKSIDWAKIKASGIVGAMVRCGYRGYETGKLNEDDMFLDHIKGAYNAGLKVGVYFFTEALNWAEGKEEAEFTLKLIEKAGVSLYYPIAIDTEAQSASTERAKHLSVAQRTDAIKGFCETIKERGGVPMIYASTNWFENKLDMSKLPYKIWCAQYYKECEYKGEVSMWQYTSEGSVSGVKGVVDMNKCYITSASPMPTPTPQPQPTPSGGYTGSFPTEDEIKAASNQGVINRSVAWAKDIARQGFDYLMPQAAGCYFCGTTKKKAYTCMPFVTAMFAHGGGDPDVLTLCKNKHSFSLRNEDSDWQMLIRKGKFAYLGRMSGIDWSAIKVGDVLVQYASDDLHGHMMLYAGNNELAEASPDIGCAITSGAKSRYARYARGESQCGEGAKNFVMRYVGTRSYMSKGDSGTAVLEWQDFLDWRSDGQFYRECGKGDGVFGANTDKWTKTFQTAVFGASEADGTVGMKTISAAKNVRK